MFYKDIVNKISTHLNMIKSFENPPNRWKLTSFDISATVCGFIDAGVDILEMELFLSPQAQQSIRRTNTKVKRINSIYGNRLSYSY